MFFPLPEWADVPHSGGGFKTNTGLAVFNMDIKKEKVITDNDADLYVVENILSIVLNSYQCIKQDDVLYACFHMAITQINRLYSQSKASDSQPPSRMEVPRSQV